MAKKDGEFKPKKVSLWCDVICDVLTLEVRVDTASVTNLLAIFSGWQKSRGFGKEAIGFHVVQVSFLSDFTGVVWVFFSSGLCSRWCVNASLKFADDFLSLF